MGHATWQRECTTLTGKVLFAWVLVNKVTHMHTYIIPCKPTPITLSVVADHFVGHKAVDDAMCQRCASVATYHQCNCSLAAVDDKTYLCHVSDFFSCR